ncbi:transposase-like protein, partial [Colletotrichum sojae]
GQPQQRLLALTQQQGRHSGEAIGLTLAAVVRGWDISTRLGVLVSDNASSNDLSGQAFFTHINPRLTEKDIIHRRIRCYDHILNLVGRAFLYGEDSESFEQESQVYEAHGDITNELRLWRKQGPVGKLHNIVKWGDTYLLHEETKFELQLILNNDTRWNSTYLMIERALKKQSQIQSFLSINQLEADPQKRPPEEDILTFEDWRLLVELQDILQPLYKQTIRTQGWAKDGSHGALWEILGGVEYLLERMEMWKTLFEDEAAAESRRYFRLSVTNGWTKLKNYYTKLGESPLYAAAIILHPKYGLEWLEHHWSDDGQEIWIREAREGVRQFWNTWYQVKKDPGPSSEAVVWQPGETQIRGPSEFDDWMSASYAREPRIELEID